jgi:hypothetical protein
MAARHTPPGELPKHGTVSRYRYHKCRCDDCRRANRLLKRRERHEGQDGPEFGMKTAQHGTRSKYVRGCRCGLCKEANRIYQREKMAERRAEGKVIDKRTGPNRRIRKKAS